MPPVRQKYRVSFKPRGAREREKQPVQLPSISIAFLPNILDIGTFLFLVTFLLLVSFLNFVRGIANLQYARIDFLQLCLRCIGLRNDLGNCLLHGFGLVDEALDQTVQLFAAIFPKLSRVLRFIVGVYKIYPRLKLLLRRHEILDLNAGILFTSRRTIWSGP